MAPTDQGPVVRSIKINRLSSYLTLVSANQASSNLAQEANSLFYYIVLKEGHGVTNFATFAPIILFCISIEHANGDVIKW